MTGDSIKRRPLPAAVREELDEIGLIVRIAAASRTMRKRLRRGWALMLDASAPDEATRALTRAEVAIVFRMAKDLRKRIRRGR